MRPCSARIASEIRVFWVRVVLGVGLQAYGPIVGTPAHRA